MRNKKYALIEALEGYINETLVDDREEQLTIIAERLEGFGDWVKTDIRTLTKRIDSNYECLTGGINDLSSAVDTLRQAIDMRESQLNVLTERITILESKISSLAGCTVAGGNSANQRLDAIEERVKKIAIPGDIVALTMRLNAIEANLMQQDQRNIEHFASTSRLSARLDEIDVTAIWRDIVALTKQLNMLDVRGVAKDELTQHLDSDEFRKRIFDIVEMQPQMENLAACVKNILSEALSNVNVVGTIDTTDL
jgi:hypothetical protein